MIMLRHSFKRNRLLTQVNVNFFHSSKQDDRAISVSSTTGSQGCSVELGKQLTRFVSLSKDIQSLTSGELRVEFIKFFNQFKSHSVVYPSKIYPKRSEGMNQFKNIMLGKPESLFENLRNAVNTQPCLRIGGRQSDLNDVGYDTNHHTMFEMLGNWSFGDYKKREACQYMWEFLTKVLKIPTNALYVTYFNGDEDLKLPPDDETRNIWLDLGVSYSKLMPFGIKDNFWRADMQSGGGLCGPSTEIHIDLLSLNDSSDTKCARCFVNQSNPQVVEVWNSVFITHKTVDGELVPLKNMFVDTGMGLERISTAIQGFTNSYDCDAFSDIIKLIHSESPKFSLRYTALFLDLDKYSSDTDNSGSSLYYTGRSPTPDDRSSEGLCQKSINSISVDFQMCLSFLTFEVFKPGLKNGVDNILNSSPI